LKTLLVSILALCFGWVGVAEAEECSVTIWVSNGTFQFGPADQLPPWTADYTQASSENLTWVNSQTFMASLQQQITTDFTDASYVTYSFPTSCGTLAYSTQPLKFVGAYTLNGNENEMFATVGSDGWNLAHYGSAWIELCGAGQHSCSCNNGAGAYCVSMGSSCVNASAPCN
jgi:hypothetical protein